MPPVVEEAQKKNNLRNIVQKALTGVSLYATWSAIQSNLRLDKFLYVLLVLRLDIDTHVHTVPTSCNRKKQRIILADF